MSIPYISSTVVDLSFSIFAATTDYSEINNYTENPLLAIKINKSDLFDISGIQYTVIRDSSGIIRDYQATGNSNIQRTNILSSLTASNVTWQTSQANSMYMLDYTYQNIHHSYAINVDYANMLMSPSSCSLGHYILYLISHALKQTRPTSLELTFGDSVSPLSLTINNSITDALHNFLSTQSVQDAIISMVIKANGPVIDSIDGYLQLDETIQDMDMHIILKSINVLVIIYGQGRSLAINEVPLKIELR